MSDPKNNPGPPPDDFSKTTPNINLPDDGGQTDWDKTNYNFPKQPQADEWGKTVTNIKPINTEQQDFGKTMYPGAKKQPEADWGATRANVNVPDTDFGSQPDDFGGYDKTTPYFKLPEAERAKYQQLPPTPAEQAAQAEKEQKEKGGVPVWVWGCAGLTAMFMFAVGILAVVYFFVIGGSGFDIVVKSAPPDGDVRVNDVSWGLTQADGSKRLVNLEPGKKVITIIHPTQNCEPREITGNSGDVIEMIARCKPAEVKPGEDCTNIGPGDEDKAERCYNAALDALPNPFTAEQLVRALNILVINFDSGKFDVPGKRLAALKKGAEFIKKLSPEFPLEVGGHTDNVGQDSSNLTLSQNRANAVKQVLVGYGVRDDALQTRGYGASKPKPGADNSTEQGRFRNRRIEYSIVKK